MFVCHFNQGLDWDRAEYHTGLRPLSADDVPIIGEAKPNFFLNTGHGSKGQRTPAQTILVGYDSVFWLHHAKEPPCRGWTHAAGSGQLVADLIAGREPYLDPESYSLGRFSTLHQKDAPYNFHLETLGLTP